MKGFMKSQNQIMYCSIYTQKHFLPSRSSIHLVLLSDWAYDKQTLTSLICAVFTGMWRGRNPFVSLPVTQWQTFNVSRSKIKVQKFTSKVQGKLLRKCHIKPSHQKGEKDGMVHLPLQCVWKMTSAQGSTRSLCGFDE